MKKAVITGTNGFIGGQLKNHLFTKEFSIMEINEDYYDLPHWRKNLEEELNDFEPDVIFHIGACSDTLETDVNYMMFLNFETTKFLSDYASFKDIAFIYSSSAASYGTNGEIPSNLYGWSKYVGESYVLLNGGIGLRYFNVYGPGEQHKDRMASMIYQIMDKSNKGEKIKLFPGHPRRDFVYIKDVIDANIHAFENFHEHQFTTFDVGTGESYMFEDILYHLNINDFDYTSYEEIPSGYQVLTRADKNKFMSGWSPKFDLKSGIEDYLLNING